MFSYLCYLTTKKCAQYTRKGFITLGRCVVRIAVSSWSDTY